MNTRTTLMLAMMLVVLGAVYIVLRSRPGPTDADTPPTPVAASAPATRDLLDEKLDDVVKVVCRPEGDEEWVFEKQDEASDTGQAVWRMASPADMKVISWEVEKFGRQLGDLKYDLSYKAGEPGSVTAAEAGLDPPRAVVSMTDSEGRTVTVEIGRAASNRNTYVRLAGSDQICLAKSDLRYLIKDKAIDYREKELWAFRPEDVTRLEIIDRSGGQAAAETSYAFVRDGARWMLESPVTARATSKVDDAIRTMSRLRVIQWQDDDAGKLAVYGLDPAALTVRAAVEEEVEVVEDDEEQETAEMEGKEEAEPSGDAEQETADTRQEKKLTTYELHLSDRSPIGDDAKTYMRVGDEHVVATVVKATVDKFKPVMFEWREMRVTTADVEAATRIGLAVPEGSATLLREGDAWLFDPDGGRAEDSAVSGLLKAIGDLAAVAFIDEEPADLASFGLDEPRAEIRLTVPGVEGAERIAVGGYTDEQAKRLTYVRRNDLASIAKVRTADVAKLVQPPYHYRDRTIVEVLPSRFERIMLSVENGPEGGRANLTLQRSGGAWSMTEPVNAPVWDDQVDRLVEALGGLRAQRVVAEEAEPTTYGLDVPSAIVTLTYKPVGEYEAEGELDADLDEVPEESGDVEDTDEARPSSRTVEIFVGERDGKHYARRSDRATVYEVSAGFYAQLFVEYRTDRVMDFDDTMVRQLTIQKGDVVHVFVRQDDRWTYQAEPDLPLDFSKVENLLLQIKDLRTPRYVSHVGGDFSEYGLSAPASEVTVALEDGANYVLRVSRQLGRHGADTGFYATVLGRSGVFLLTADSVNRFEVSLDGLEERS